MCDCYIHEYKSVVQTEKPRGVFKIIEYVYILLTLTKVCNGRDTDWRTVDGHVGYLLLNKD